MAVPSEIIVWDAEFLTDQGAMQRMWCGPTDPDPVLVQLGAVRLSMTGTFEISSPFRMLVRPRDRFGEAIQPSAFFCKLTGLSADAVARDGVPLAEALERFADYCRGAPVWAWGKDEFHAVAISCYVEGIAPPMPATQFGNGPSLMMQAGVPVEDILQMRSHTMLPYFDLPEQGEQAHDALGDAQSVARVFQHLLVQGRLSAQDFARP
ncbi:3'-5' exonuclease family protein [Thalassococcus lentus]|uniref:Exonuclease n=1 Tax=Thalassococcus lentus TaxID=1210524 RepID=A0ABT4XS77_9RHOB|nr:exonuclease [Thalassococcus lentus]MDA7424757.1 exonuclease [Thalassococcus lentus]